MSGDPKKTVQQQSTPGAVASPGKSKQLLESSKGMFNNWYAAIKEVVEGDDDPAQPQQPQQPQRKTTGPSTPSKTSPVVANPSSPSPTPTNQNQSTTNTQTNNSNNLNQNQVSNSNSTVSAQNNNNNNGNVVSNIKIEPTNKNNANISIPTTTTTTTNEPKSLSPTTNNNLVDQSHVQNNTINNEKKTTSNTNIQVNNQSTTTSTSTMPEELKQQELKALTELLSSERHAENKASASNTVTNNNPQIRTQSPAQNTTVPVVAPVVVPNNRTQSPQPNPTTVIPTPIPTVTPTAIPTPVPVAQPTQPKSQPQTQTQPTTTPQTTTQPQPSAIPVAPPAPPQPKQSAMASFNNLVGSMMKTTIPAAPPPPQTTNQPKTQQPTQPTQSAQTQQSTSQQSTQQSSQSTVPPAPQPPPAPKLPSTPSGKQTLTDSLFSTFSGLSLSPKATTREEAIQQQQQQIAAKKTQIPRKQLEKEKEERSKAAQKRYLDEDNMTVQFDADLQSVISEIVPQSNSPLDSMNFSTVDYINGRFKDASSLDNLEDAISKLKSQIHHVEEVTYAAVRDQVSAGSRGRQELDLSKKAIAQLLEKIADIEKKAEKSEKMVTELCRDIKVLDHGKKNLSKTMSALIKFQLFVNGMNQLKNMVSTRQYNDAANLLKSINDFSPFLDQFAHLPSIQLTKKDVALVKHDIFQKINNEFSEHLKNPHVLDPVLGAACLVADELGEEQRRDIMGRFIQRRLDSYNDMVNPEGDNDNAKLANIERRFAWMNKEFQQYDNVYKANNIFPPSWKVDEKLCEEFCFATRTQLGELLEKAREDNLLTVDEIVVALTKTVEFENELGNRYGEEEIEEPTLRNSQVAVAQDQDDDDDKEDDQTPEEVSTNPHSAAAIRARYKKFMKESEKKKKQEAGKKKLKIQKFKGIISSVFETVMDLYTAKEDQELRKALDKMMTEENERRWTVVDDLGVQKILQSATLLIFYFKDRVKQCSQLTKKQALFKLHELFRKYLMEYARTLSDHLPSDLKIYVEADEITTSLIINTAEYFEKNLEGLTKSFQKKVDPGYVEKIDFSAAKTEFANLTAKGVKSLVDALLRKIDNSAFKSMIGIPWSSLDLVGDQSSYVDQIATYVHQSIPIYRHWLINPMNFDHLIFSFSMEFLGLLTKTVHKLKSPSTNGGHQLLIDFKTLSTILLQLPDLKEELGNELSASSKARYAKGVKKGMAKADNLIKLVAITPADKLVETYAQLAIDKSEADFRSILNIRNIGKMEQGKYMTQYMQLVGADKREPTSSNSGNTPQLNIGAKAFDLESSKKAMKDIWSKTTDAFTFTDKKLLPPTTERKM